MYKSISMTSKSTSSDTGSLPIKEITNQVKRSILLIYGINNPLPDTLANNASMSGFNFNDYQWMELAFSLTRIIRNYNSNQSVTAPDLQNMLMVQDCIDIVIQKCKS